MRSVPRLCCRPKGQFDAVASITTMALLLFTAGVQTARGMPLVVPRQCLPNLCPLNPAMNISLIGLSQTPISSTGSMMPTAVVDLSPPSGTAGPDGSFPLFIFPSDVPAIQQLNGGMQISMVGVAQSPEGSGVGGAPVAQVSVSGLGRAQSQSSDPGCLFVFPASGLPLLSQLNPALDLTTMCVSQLGTTPAGPGTQTALVNVLPNGGSVAPSQPVLMLVPVDQLPALGQFNQSATIDVINVVEMPANNGATIPVTLVGMQQNPQTLCVPSKGSSTPSAGKKPEQDSQEGDDHSKGHEKGHHHGNRHSEDSDDQGDD